jgi:hypothetical protein
LEKAVITFDDPGICVEWDEAAVDAFVVIANLGNAAGGGPLPAAPALITSAAGAMSRATFTNDVIAFCAAVGGGRVGVILIAPNDFRQYHLVSQRFQAVELDGFVQSCVAQLPPAGQVLARLYHLSDKSVVHAQRLDRAPLPGTQLVFS